jgi:hypothetical protein
MEKASFKPYPVAFPALFDHLCGTGYYLKLLIVFYLVLFLFLHQIEAPRKPETLTRLVPVAFPKHTTAGTQKNAS